MHSNRNTDTKFVIEKLHFTVTEPDLKVRRGYIPRHPFLFSYALSKRASGFIVNIFWILSGGKWLPLNEGWPAA
jgi:hypothetical protein